MTNIENKWTLYDWMRNPPEVYAKMRARGPIQWSDEYHGWLVIDYDLARELLKDARLSSDTTNSLKLTTFPTRSRDKVDPLIELYRSWLIFSDPPYHTVLRNVLNPYFTKPALAERALSIERHARELLSACHGEWEVMSQLAGPLPSRVMADLMELPYEGIPDFLEWDAQLAAFIESILRSPDLTSDALLAMENQKYFFNEAIKNSSSNGFIQQLWGEVKKEKLFSEENYWQLLSMLLATGTETTKNLIGSGLFALLSYPEQYQLLQQKPELLNSALDECLRFYSPIQSVFRLTTENISIDNVTIEQGHYVRIILGGINRDPKHFHHPDTFDILRNPNKHLSFGVGIHFCIGRWLAQLEAQIVFPMVIEKFPNLTLVTKNPEWVGGTTFRGLKSFCVFNKGERK